MCIRDSFKGGEGRVVNRVILPAEGMYGKGRIFNVGRLEKNCEIGWHIHEGEDVYKRQASAAATSAPWPSTRAAWSRAAATRASSAR